MTLFDASSLPPVREQLEEGAFLLRGFAKAESPALIEEVGRIAEVAPFRYLTTKGGYAMSVAMTNCGRVGWVSDRTGYRYDPIDPDGGASWPPMPAVFRNLAGRAAAEAGFADYDPDACLINRYQAGSELGLHQDRDEKDAWAPIVSVSLGRPAVFLWGGKRRSDSVRRLLVESGDVAVWGSSRGSAFNSVTSILLRSATKLAIRRPVSSAAPECQVVLQESPFWKQIRYSYPGRRLPSESARGALWIARTWSYR
jgi:alkylated DNA repair protein (DNA oxidative demethylase)